MSLFDKMPEPKGGKPTQTPVVKSSATSTSTPPARPSSVQTAKAGPKSLQPQRREVWTEDQSRQLVEGTLPDEQIREKLVKKDSRGMLVTTYATLTTAKKVDDLKALLETPQKEAGQVDQMLEVLEQILKNQVELSAKVDLLRSELKTLSSSSGRYGSSAQSSSNPRG